MAGEGVHRLCAVHTVFRQGPCCGGDPAPRMGALSRCHPEVIRAGVSELIGHCSFATVRQGWEPSVGAFPWHVTGSHQANLGEKWVGWGVQCRPLYLPANVQVAVDGQHGALEAADGFGEELVGGMLQELLQEKLRRGCQQCVLAVRGAHILKGLDGRRALGHLQEPSRVWGGARSGLAGVPS